MSETKTCTKCGEEKSLDAYSRNAGSADGRRTECKECARVHRRAKREAARSFAEGAVTKACEVCGGSFTVPLSQSRHRFCSYECRGRAAARVRAERGRELRAPRWGERGKVCRACGRLLSASSFRKSRCAPDGLGGVCRACVAGAAEVECARCGTLFVPGPNSAALYCSPRCTARHRAERVETKACRHCGGEMPLHAQRVHCSRRCYLASRRRRMLDRETACLNCRKVFIPSSSNPGRYCSPQCSGEGRKLHLPPWHARHPERVSAKRARRRARLLGAEGSHSAKDLLRLWHRQRGECARCGVRFGKRPRDKGYHVDHVTPLSRGGSNWPRNLQLLCPSCNCSKQDKTPAEYTLYLRRLEREAA